MAIDDGMKVTEIRSVGCLDKNTSGFVLLAFKGMSQIISIVTGMNHRIADIRTRYFDPAERLVINLFLGGKVDALHSL